VGRPAGKVSGLMSGRESRHCRDRSPLHRSPEPPPSWGTERSRSNGSPEGESCGAGAWGIPRPRSSCRWLRLTAEQQLDTVVKQEWSTRDRISVDAQAPRPHPPLPPQGCHPPPLTPWRVGPGQMGCYNEDGTSVQVPP